MRESFRRYGELAKQVANKEKVEENEGEEREVETVFRYLARPIIERTGASEEVQKEIFSIQQEKQKKMEDLHLALREIDHPMAEFHRDPTARFVIEEGEKLYWLQDDGSRLEVTAGAILSDTDWGVKYQLDPKTVSRLLR